MEVKDQLRQRMTDLRVSVKQLAEQLGVSDQTVRHWLSGRSFPGKGKAPALEDALSFKLDYSQGATAHPPVADAREDVAGLLAITRLPPSIKKLVFEFAAALDAELSKHPVRTPK